MFLAVVVAAVIIVVTACVFVHRAVDGRAHEVMAVNNWFSDQMMLHPPEPLSPEHIAVIKSLMDDDRDLWWHLGESADREPYYQHVIDFGCYAHTLGADALPSLCYGVFDDYGSSGKHRAPIFRVWIEFLYQNETVWVLYGGDNWGCPTIVRFGDFRVNHPGLVHRHPITFFDDLLNDDLVMRS